MASYLDTMLHCSLRARSTAANEDFPHCIFAERQNKAPGKCWKTLQILLVWRGWPDP
ncbi:hypothetical protein [Azoarcus sp. DD4]|uniref:hypothetical protein n=1 Tax=Azoarcus sp. DD4 TaxID=2027405 RepID=UPI00143DE6EE|nr:hypothetical protein [Azoarcus sp. DD4]